MRKTPSDWVRLSLRGAKDFTADEAFAKHCDGKFVWVHGYLVWPHLTVYATISGPIDIAQNEQNWAYKALASLSVAVQ